jgi:predicted methyltransferase
VSGATWLALVVLVALAVVAAACASRSTSTSHAEQAALRPGGKLLVVEFSLRAHRGPPAGMRLAPETVVADLAAAGLAAKVVASALPDQYLVEARR